MSRILGMVLILVSGAKSLLCLLRMNFRCFNGLRFLYLVFVSVVHIKLLGDWELVSRA